MSIHRTAARRDGNEQEIIRALRAAGYSVQQLSGKGVPDLLVGVGGVNVLLEVKDGFSARMTAAEEFWHTSWRGQAAVVYDARSALAEVARMLSRITAPGHDVAPALYQTTWTMSDLDDEIAHMAQQATAAIENGAIVDCRKLDEATVVVCLVSDAETEHVVVFETFAHGVLVYRLGNSHFCPARVTVDQVKSALDRAITTSQDNAVVDDVQAEDHHDG